MRKAILSILVAIISINYATSQVTDGLPANPEPGKCYVKCTTPDEYKTEYEEVMVKPSYKILTVQPATFKWVTEKVLVKEASKKFIYHPATYKTVEVPYVKIASYKKLRVVPAQFGNSSKTIEIFPKTGKWEYTPYSECTSPDPNDCKTLCYVEKDPVYQTVKITTLEKDASVEESTVPEVKATYKKQVIDKPAWVEEVEIPAQYATIKKKVVDQPARVVEKVIPAVYKKVEKKVLVKKGGITTWEEIDCGLVKPNIININWDLNSARLNAAAKAEIDRVILPILKEKPNVRIELASHTDSRGSDAYNLALSQRRADAIKNYLISKGISPDRIISKGYGETRLLNHCSNGVKCTEAQHRVNRRTEFRIIGN
jgi:outer membrane protein OmpA-like peptidoglycan-associated protein